MGSIEPAPGTGPAREFGASGQPSSAVPVVDKPLRRPHLLAEQERDLAREEFGAALKRTGYDLSKPPQGRLAIEWIGKEIARVEYEISLLNGEIARDYGQQKVGPYGTIHARRTSATTVFVLGALGAAGASVLAGLTGYLHKAAFGLPEALIGFASVLIATAAFSGRIYLADRKETNKLTKDMPRDEHQRRKPDYTVLSHARNRMVYYRDAARDQRSVLEKC